MGKFVADVSEVGDLGFESGGGFEGLIDGGVGRVGFVAEGVEEEDVEILEEFERGVWDVVVVRQIGEFAEAESVNGHGAVEERDGDDGFSKEIEGSAGEGLDSEMGAAGFLFAIGEDVLEDAADDVEGVGAAVDGDVGLLPEIKGADIVEAEDVVGVAVSEENGVEFGDAGAEGLVAEVGGGVDDDFAAPVADPGGGAEAAVAGIGRGADGAIAGDGRDADAGAGAEDGEGEGVRRQAIRLPGTLALPRLRRAVRLAAWRLRLP